MITKGFLKSKTIWAGATEIGIGFFDLSTAAFECTFHGLQAGWILIVIGGLKIWLRMISKGNIVFKKEGNNGLSRLFGGGK